MSKATHTKTPWRIGRNGADYCVFAGDEKFIADCDRSDDMDGSPEDIANAAFIVRAANSHDALVEALKKTVSVVTGDIMSKSGLIDALESARAALALAEADE